MKAEVLKELRHRGAEFQLASPRADDLCRKPRQQQPRIAAERQPRAGHCLHDEAIAAIGALVVVAGLCAVRQRRDRQDACGIAQRLRVAWVNALYRKGLFKEASVRRTEHSTLRHLFAHWIDCKYDKYHICHVPRETSRYSR